MPRMVPVESSTVREVGYAERTAELYVQFMSGALFIYINVPHDVYVEFLGAPSKGTFFIRSVKERFAYRRVDPSSN